MPQCFVSKYTHTMHFGGWKSHNNNDYTWPRPERSLVFSKMSVYLNLVKIKNIYSHIQWSHTHYISKIYWSIELISFFNGLLVITLETFLTYFNQNEAQVRANGHYWIRSFHFFFLTLFLGDRYSILTWEYRICHLNFYILFTICNKERGALPNHVIPSSKRTIMNASSVSYLHTYYHCQKYGVISNILHIEWKYFTVTTESMNPLQFPCKR